MSDTPRTDANYVCHYGDGLGQWVPREFACELERELAAAQKDSERYRRAREFLQRGDGVLDTRGLDDAGFDKMIDSLKECGK